MLAYVNPQGSETKYTYTADGKIRRQENPDGTTQEWRYQLDGRRVKETLTDGTYWETTYNDAERTATRTQKNSSGETLTQESYKFDPRGNIISYTDEQNQTTTREYDKLNRLIAEIGSSATAEAAQRRPKLLTVATPLPSAMTEEKNSS